ncbi:MAG: hypothetical protein GXO66_08835 [Euryarchaeota archaeon]|nr:hypothetical protein [Euryarchaeota archaeon]
MRHLLIAVAKELFLFSPEEAEKVILEVKGELRRETLEKNLEALARERLLLALLPEESTLNAPALVQGPAFEGGSSEEVKRALIELGLERRGPGDVRWSCVAPRILAEIESLASQLEEDIKLLYHPPRRLEMRYFDLALEYHQHYSHFLRLNFSDSLPEQIDLAEWERFSSKLKKLREMLDRLEY